ncbi:hypothetical protein [Mycolicibacterium neoaurum]|uniref:hypothetical protein n=1 Tax=Mycolicibacterium neoaurum TaxID=1795 RepID=UPI001F4C8EE5|nr:hypothetical protein [Mycolicibacterium neoaurum]
MNTPAKPPQPGSAEHWAAWLERYGGDYATHDERRAAYQDFTTNLTTMQAVFSQSDRMHVAGYLEAHERVASGDADGPDDAEVGFRLISTAMRARTGLKASAHTSSRRPR